jgi:hypothetical protein
MTVFYLARRVARQLDTLSSFGKGAKWSLFEDHDPDPKYRAGEGSRAIKT